MSLEMSPSPSESVSEPVLINSELGTYPLNTSIGGNICLAI